MTLIGGLFIPSGRLHQVLFGAQALLVDQPELDLGGDDLLIGGPADDVLLGEGGDDALIGGGGDDFIDGGEGDDSVLAPRVEPIAYWNLNEIGGNLVADSAGTPQDGTFFGPHPDLDDGGPDVAFDAETGADFHHTTKEYIAIAHDEVFEVASGAVQLWFNTRHTSGDQALFSKDHSGFVDGGHLNIRLDHSHIEVRLQGEGASHTIRTGHVVEARTWHHLAFTFGGDGSGPSA